MADDQDSNLARLLVQAYLGSGIPAKLHRGGIYLVRERGWEGPLALRALLPTYREEIRQIERTVKVEVNRCLARVSLPLAELEDYRDIWVSVHMSPECFQALGFSLETAELYVSVARQLRYKGELWD